MDLALTINAWIDEEVMFAQQLGTRHVFARVDSQPDGAPAWEAQHLGWLANRVEKAGLVLAGLAVTELPLERVTRLLEAAGAARIGLVSLPAGLFSGGASAAALAETAERAGVKVAFPAAALAAPGAQDTPRGARRLTAEGIPESLRGLPSCAGLDAAPDMLPELLQNANQDRLYLVSIENEQRPTGKRSSARFDELLPICWRLHQAGYSGLIRLGQPSKWKNDTLEGHQARAFSTGYFRAALQAFARAGAPR